MLGLSALDGILVCVIHRDTRAKSLVPAPGRAAPEREAYASPQTPSHLTPAEILRRVRQCQGQAVTISCTRHVCELTQKGPSEIVRRRQRAFRPHRVASVYLVLDHFKDVGIGAFSRDLEEIIK